jgi:hypothetical protein
MRQIMHPANFCDPRFQIEKYPRNLLELCQKIEIYFLKIQMKTLDAYFFSRSSSTSC